MRWGLLLGLTVACLAYKCDKMLVTIFDGAPPHMIKFVKNTLKTKLGPQAKVKLIFVHENPQDGNSAEVYLNVVGVPIHDSMWKLEPHKPNQVKLVNVSSQEPFAKSSECKKKGFKVKTQHRPLSFFYKLSREQGYIK